MTFALREYSCGDYTRTTHASKIFIPFRGLLFQLNFAFRAAIRRASDRSQGKFTIVEFQVIPH